MSHPKTALDATNEMLDAELASKLGERRRVTIAQMADFDFPDLCRKLQMWVGSGPDGPDLPCLVCGATKLGSVFCLACARVAMKTIAETVATVDGRWPQLFRGVRTNGNTGVHVLPESTHW